MRITAGLSSLSEALAVLVSLGWQREAAYVNGLMADVLAWAGRKSEAIKLLDETLADIGSLGSRGIRRQDPMQEGHGVGNWPGCRHRCRGTANSGTRLTSRGTSRRSCSSCSRARGLARLWLTARQAYGCPGSTGTGPCVVHRRPEAARSSGSARRCLYSPIDESGFGPSTTSVARRRSCRPGQRGRGGSMAERERQRQTALMPNRFR